MGLIFAIPLYQCALYVAFEDVCGVPETDGAPWIQHECQRGPLNPQTGGNIRKTCELPIG